MEILFWPILLLSGPVFYITGLIVFIRWIARGGRNAEQYAAKVAAEKVRNLALGETGEVVGKLRQVADELSSRGLAVNPAAAPAAASEPASSEAAGPPEPSEKAPAAKHQAAPAPAKSSWTSVDVGEAMRNLDNINILLYLGAFLIVVSAGIFVGYNFETLSGGFKTWFLALFAAAFYGTGLSLFLNKPKLRPAGVTFTGIGLVLLPLVGLAAYNFTSLHDHGSATWFVTSLLTLAAYAYTLYVTRQTYVAYLMAFTTLSLFESSVSLIDLPIYWFGWGMATTSILLLAASRTKLLWKDAAEALMFSANIFVPVSLLLSMITVAPHGLTQLGVTIALAAVFYAEMAVRFARKQEGAVYWCLALVLLPAALATGLWPHISREAVAVALMAVCAGYFAAGYTRETLPAHWRDFLAAITGLLPLAALLVVIDHMGWVSAILVLAALVNGALGQKQKQGSLGFLAIAAVLALPYVFLRGYLTPAAPWAAVSAAYLAAAPLLVWWAHRMRGWTDDGEAIGVAGYLSAMGLAVLTALAASSTAVLLVSLAVAAGLYAIATTDDRRFALMYPAAAALYLAAVQITDLAFANFALNSTLLLIAGAGVYALGWYEQDEQRSLALRYAGLCGPFIGAFLGIGQEVPHYDPVFALATGGALLLLESQRQNQPVAGEFAGGILVLSFNWLLNVAGITQTQAFTIPWAGYIAYLGYRRRELGHAAYDPFAAVALAILTIPLAGQALGENGAGYGLLLIFEGLALVFIGMAINYRLMTAWGATTLVLEVLYQLRDFLYALPKYVISASLGLALLAVAIVMLQRRRGD